MLRSKKPLSKGINLATHNKSKHIHGIANTQKANLMHEITILDVKHYTDRLFSFKAERPQSFRFRSGEFVMIGLKGDNGKPLLRAYSIASPSWDDGLEFYSIKVPNGPLTSKLQHIQVGDRLIMGQKLTGTLVSDALLSGKTLYMLSTGTGFAPFASLIRDPEIYERFEKIIVAHSCREVAELSYSQKLIAHIHQDEILSEIVGDKLHYFATTTRENFPQMGRLTTLIENGSFFDKIGENHGFSPEHDRVMICGSQAMLHDLKHICLAHGLEEGSNSSPATFVIEKAFVG